VSTSVRVIVISALALAVPFGSACSDDEGSSSSATLQSVPSPDTAPIVTLAPGDVPFLRVDLIDDAIAAVEDERGGPQEFFEINATPNLVNLFVADTDAGQAIPYIYVDGALTAEDPSDATGNTFPSSAVVLDPSAVTGRVSQELPDSIQEAFVIEGGPEGSIRRTIVLTSASGGQLLVVVGPDGAITSVDAVG